MVGVSWYAKVCCLGTKELLLLKFLIEKIGILVNEFFYAGWSIWMIVLMMIIVEMMDE